MPAKTLPAHGAYRIASINRGERKQEQADVRLAHAFDESSPGEIGQMNLMARLIRQASEGRQNDESDEYPAESCTHSHARLTATATECQERTRARVLKSPHVL